MRVTPKPFASAEAFVAEFMPSQATTPLAGDRSATDGPHRGSGSLFMRMVRGCLRQIPEMGTNIDHVGNLHLNIPAGVRITLRPDMTWDFHE